jgi:CRISPR/Cas system-associated endonuclease/helicase Cas3
VIDNLADLIGRCARIDWEVGRFSRHFSAFQIHGNFFGFPSASGHSSNPLIPSKKKKPTNLYIIQPINLISYYTKDPHKKSKTRKTSISN